MKFALQLLLGGSLAALVGIWWMIDGFANGSMNHLLGGLIWKGALLFLAGGAAAGMGSRMFREINAPKDRSESHAQIGAGKPEGAVACRMKINRIGLEKIYVFAKGREATLNEMMIVLSDPHYKIEAGENSEFNTATEEWNSLPDEDEAAGIQRVAREVADKHPGMSVAAFAWPETQPTLIAAFVTETKFHSPFATAKK